MNSSRRTPPLTDRGYGIGRHSHNDTFAVRGGFATVNEIIVSDVFGDETYRYDVATRTVTTLSGEPVAEPRWTWAQVEEVVTRDLATLPTPVAFGGKYGSFRTETLFGLYSGKRPRWMAPEAWAAKKALPTGA